MQADLTGRVAVVYGGTRGIGRAIALKYAACGAQVVIQGRDAAAAAAIIAEAAPAGPRPLFVAADFTQPSEIDRVAATAVSQFGKLDIVVANGNPRRSTPKLFQDVAPEEVPAYFDDRLFTRLYMIQSAFHRMKEQKYGKIIAITTDAGRTPTPSESLVGAAAAGLIFATRALAKEFSRTGVRINTIAISLTKGTPWWDKYLRAVEQGSDAVIIKAFRKIEANAPFGLNEPEDLAELALYLAAPESDRLSGATFSLNGGISFPAYA